MTEAVSSPPGFVRAVVAGVVRHALTGAAGAMAAAGMIQKDQQSQLVGLGVSLALWGFGVWWSAIQKKNSLPQAVPPDEPPH